jgi:molybdopterin-guanine dinucleotide biosynthesis protein A
MPSNKPQHRLPDDCGVVVLSGGGSARMGVDKSALLIGDATTFLHRIVGRAVGLTDKIVISVGHNRGESSQTRYADCPEFKNVIWAEDSVANQGPMEGIHQGLKTLAQNFPNCQRAFVTSCDVPELNGDLILELLNRIGDYDALTPVAGKRVYGMTAVYRCSVWKAAARNVASQQLRVSTLAQSVSSTTVNLSDLKTVDPQLNSFENINTPEDYFAYLKKTNVRCSDKMKQQFP